MEMVELSGLGVGVEPGQAQLRSAGLVPFLQENICRKILQQFSN